jgi:hypothetical protein
MIAVVRHRFLLLLALLAGSAALVWWLASDHAAAQRKQSSSSPSRPDPDTVHRVERYGGSAGSPAAYVSYRLPSGSSSGRVVVQGSWGSGPGQFGRRPAEESNPEAPMSLFVDDRGNLSILDQVNRRVQRFDRSGVPLPSIPIPTETAQDLLQDGERLLVLDRLGPEPGVQALDLEGNELFKLPVVGGSLREGGAITGLFSDTEGLYVENGHDDLVRVADAESNATDLQQTVPGRPSRDGRLYLKAGIIDEETGRVYLQAHDRQRELAWETPLSLGRPLLHLLLLDSDKQGQVYLGAEVGHEDPATYEIQELATLVVRLDNEGHLAGVLTLPPSTSDPAETFRPLAVDDEGRIYHLVPGESGLTVTVYEFSDG